VGVVLQVVLLPVVVLGRNRYRLFLRANPTNFNREHSFDASNQYIPEYTEDIHFLFTDDDRIEKIPCMPFVSPSGVFTVTRYRELVTCADCLEYLMIWDIPGDEFGGRGKLQ